MSLVRVWTRAALAGPPGEQGARGLLLEGSWEEIGVDDRRSLDEAIDARFAWIDEEAQRLAASAGAENCPGEAGEEIASPAWLHALALRYYLVKLLRVVAWFTEIRPLEQGDAVELVAQRGQDEDYADVIGGLARRAAAEVRIRWIEAPCRPAEKSPVNARWRRWLGALSTASNPRGTGGVVLCGNPRILDPVCGELAARGCRVWWLYDRFALRSWIRWRRQGIGQLVCDSSLGEGKRGHSPFAVSARRVLPTKGARSFFPFSPPGPLQCRGVDLSLPLGRWIEEQWKSHGPADTRLVEQIDEHFRRIRPDRLVLAEDATPMSRAAVAAARHCGAESFVVQHGAPLARFGFVPPAADRLLVWGQPAKRQLERWGVEPQRIEAVGSPWHDLLFRELCRWKRKGLGRLFREIPRRSEGPRILLLTTVPPRNDRPDVVALRHTRATYRKMLWMAVAAVADIAGAELVVKLHPRAADDPMVRDALARFPRLKARIVCGRLERCIAQADCVLSCISSAGVDATLAGVPVVQLVPAGSGDVLRSDEWGMFASARTREELERRLHEALGGSDFAKGGAVSARSCPTRVFGHLDGHAAARVVDAILRLPLETVAPSLPVPLPHGERGTLEAAGPDPLPQGETSVSIVPSPVALSPGEGGIASAPQAIDQPQRVRLKIGPTGQTGPTAQIGSTGQLGPGIAAKG